MYTESTVPLERLGVARAKANEIRALLNNHILAHDNAEKDQFEQKIEANDELIENQLALVRPSLSTEEGKTAFAAIERHLEDYRQVRDRILRISHGTGKPGIGDAEIVAITGRASALNHDQAVPTFAKVADGFDKLFDSKVALAHEEDEEVKALFASRRTLALVLLGLALALGVAAWLRIARGIKRGVDVVLDRLSMLRDNDITGVDNGVRALADGDLTVEVVPVTPHIKNMSHDEVGDVARAVNEIRDKAVATIASYNDTRGSLTELIGQAASTATSLSAASQQMATPSDEAGRAVGEIASAVGEVAQGAERQVRMVDSAKRAPRRWCPRRRPARRTPSRRPRPPTRRARWPSRAQAPWPRPPAMGAVRASSQRATEAIRELGAKSGQIGGSWRRSPGSPSRTTCWR